ncbi:hypothetical protein D3C81_174300 [compost metagenome]
MTRDEILAMDPGKDLDVLVSEKVMGWKKGHGSTWIVGKTTTGKLIQTWKFRRFSSDISAAWEVADKFYYTDVRKVNGTKWIVRVGIGDGRSYNATGNTAPEAICKSALLAHLEATS